jgi:hypothetical protein
MELNKLMSYYYMITDVREMTIADYEKEFSDAGVAEIIKIMNAFKSVLGNKHTHKPGGDEFKEFN